MGCWDSFGVIVIIVVAIAIAIAIVIAIIVVVILFITTDTPLAFYDRVAFMWTLLSLSLIPWRWRQPTC